MKKQIIVILAIIGLICSVGVVMAGNQEASDNPNDIQSISKNGISIKFPSDWGIAKTSSNHSLIAIAKLNSIDSEGVAQVNINIEKNDIDGSFEDYVNDTYAKMEKLGDYNLTSSGQVVIGSLQGLEYNYLSEDNDTVREHKAIWLDDGDQVYVILYSAPLEEFDENLKVFEFVVNNFHLN